MNKTQFRLLTLSVLLRAQRKRMTLAALADDLNAHGCRTPAGHIYDREGPRLRAVYLAVRELVAMVRDEWHLPEEAQALSETFSQPNGTPAYQWESSSAGFAFAS